MRPPRSREKRVPNNIKEREHDAYLVDKGSPRDREVHPSAHTPKPSGITERNEVSLHPSLGVKFFLWNTEPKQIRV